MFDDIMKQLDGLLDAAPRHSGSIFPFERLGTMAEWSIALALRALLASRHHDALASIAQFILERDGRHQGWDGVLDTVAPLSDGSGFLLKFVGDPSDRQVARYFADYHEAWKRAGWRLEYFFPKALYGKEQEKCGAHTRVGMVVDPLVKMNLGEVPVCRFCGMEMP